MGRFILESYKTHNPFTFSGAGQTRAALSKEISSHEKGTLASLAREGEDSPGVCTTACKFFS